MFSALQIRAASECSAEDAKSFVVIRYVMRPYTSSQSCYSVKIYLRNFSEVIFVT